MNIAIGADHAGYEYKEHLRQALSQQGHHVLDHGPQSDDSVDYPDFVHPTAEAVAQGRADLGIVVCGSGNGVAITANKHTDIRCALCWQVDLARLARQHNNANMIAIPARFVAVQLAQQMVDTFIHTDFEGGRHQRRVDKIACR